MGQGEELPLKGTLFAPRHVPSPAAFQLCGNPPGLGAQQLSATRNLVGFCSPPGSVSV